MITLTKDFVYNDSENGFGTFENLSKIVDQTNQNFANIDISSLTDDISTLQNELSTINNDVSNLISDISTLSEDISNLDVSLMSLLSYGYTIFVQAGLDAAIGDNELNYFCSTPQPPSVNNEFVRAVFVPRTGKITSASLIMNAAAGDPGSAGDISTYIRINRTTDYHISTVNDSSTLRIFENNNLDISVNQGDIIVIKVQHPNYANNPSDVGWSGNLFLTSPL